VTARTIVVVGASAGGVEALTRLCAGLPEDFPAAVCIVQHLSPDSQSMLPKLLDRAGKLRVSVPQDGEAIRPGHVYVAPPDHHLLLRPGRLLLRRGPHENRSRPSIDVLFRSAAVAYGSAVVGVVLTGLLDDGAEGLIAIRQAGGLSVVQDPAEAAWPSMPLQALERDGVDHVATLDAMPALLLRLLSEPAEPGRLPAPEVVIEDRLAEGELPSAPTAEGPPGRPSRLGCPDCGGVLNEIESHGLTRFRCQVGHAFSALGLATAQHRELERALAVAVRTHRDRMRLFRLMEASALSRNLTLSATRWQRAAVEAGRMAERLEQAMLTLHPQPDTAGA
jgi:two-component system chemotaxis response regulator CheB